MTKSALKKRRHRSSSSRSSNNEELKDIVHAIRRGGVDALVMEDGQSSKVVTLKEEEHPYRLIVEAVNDGAATLDGKGTILYANARFAEILGVSLDKIVGTNVKSYLSSTESEKLENLIEKALHSSTGEEVTLAAIEGRPRSVRFSLSSMKKADFYTVCVVATELTELREANEALKSNEESLRLLSGRLLQLQDEERRRISRDLHDITGQKLAVQSMILSGILSRKSANLDPEIKATLSECLGLTQEVSSEVRTLSYLLHPPLLDELGLAAAVKWYAAGVTERSGISVEVTVPKDLQRLSSDAEVAIFRVIQESLTNVHRYSGSSKAYVHIDVRGDLVRVEIGDFGKGIPEREATNERTSIERLGVGIQGMKERMRQIGGRLEIASSANRGTVVTATLSLPAQGAAKDQELFPSTASTSLETGLDSPVSADVSRRKRILIADDHEMLRRGLRNTLLQESDFEVCGEAVDGQDAVEKVKALCPDLVILDINMPVLNGLAVIRQILHHRARTKILVFSVHDSAQTIKEISAAGAHGFLSKGKDSRNLLTLMREILEITVAADA